MAKLASLPIITGTFGELSIYNSSYGVLARKKGGPDAKKFKKHQSFEGSRRMSNELGYCSKLSSAVRRIIRMQSGNTDKTLYHRLMKLTRQIIALDPVNFKGKRRITEGLKTEAGKLMAQSFKVGIDISQILQREGENLEKFWFLQLPLTTSDPKRADEGNFVVQIPDQCILKTPDGKEDIINNDVSVRTKKKTARRRRTRLVHRGSTDLLRMTGKVRVRAESSPT